MDAPQAAQVASVELRIQWVPQLGQFRVSWPEIDDVIKLGMLQFAQTLLLEQRMKNGVAGDRPLVVPARGSLG